MSGGENKAIPVEPIRVLRVIPHDLIVQYMTHRSTTHGQTRVTRIRLLHGIDRQESDGVDGLLHQRGIRLLKRLHSRVGNHTAARGGHLTARGGA